MGMGGAGIAGVADYAAFFVNPAGLGYFQSSMIGGALHSAYTIDESIYRTPGFSAALNQSTNRTNPGNIALLYKIPTVRGSFVIGGAYQHVNTFERHLRFVGTNTTSTVTTSFLPFNDEFALGKNNSLDFLADIPFAAFNGGVIEYFPEFLEDDPDAYPFLEAVVPGSTIEQIGSVIEKGRVHEINFGGAAEAVRGLMVGISFNFPIGTYEYSNLFTEDDFNNENRAEHYSVILDDGRLLEGFDFLEMRDYITSRINGGNGRIGVTYNFTQNVRLGAVLESPTYYNIREEYGRQFDTFFDDGGRLSYGSKVDDVGTGIFEYRILTPWRWGFGGSFSTPNLTVLADVEFVDWRQLELESRTERGLFDEINRSIREQYTSALNTRLGLEYQVNGVMLRGGFAYQPDPLDLDLRRGDGTQLDRDKIFVSAGLGYRYQNQFQIDFGWMQGRFDSFYSAYPEDNLGPRQDEVLIVDEKIIQNQFVVGVSVFF